MQNQVWRLLLLLACATMAQDGDQPKAAELAKLPRMDAKWVSQMQWRPIGPASMGGRIVDLEVVSGDPFTFYLATASGGLFKTTNNGTTFTPVFEKQSTVSIGDAAVSRSNPNIIWVGTGEHNARNSVSWGDGVYKSIDGGKTWANMGLKKSFQIGRIAIHPTNPDIVYVGALGRLWGTNEERGVYKTTDGGKSWKKVLSVDDKTGCVELKMHPKEPETLIVAMYERQRDEFDTNDPAKRWGPGSGIYKTIDGGANWTRLKNGLPTRPLGRVGICYYEKNPDIVYAIVETDKIGDGPAMAFMGISGGNRVREAIIQGVTSGGPSEKAGIEAGDLILQMGEKEVKSYNDLIVAIRAKKPGDTVKVRIKREEKELELDLTFSKRGGDTSRPFTSYLGGQRANAMKEQGKLGNETGGIYRSDDGGESWTRINSLNPRPFYYSKLFVDPSDDKYIYVMGIQFHYSTDRGKTFKTGARGVHPDHHALWINPIDGRHLILGCDGGLYITYDRGVTWDFHNVMDIGQFYDVGVDTRAPYWVYGGLQDNGSWGAPNRKRGTLGPLNSDWLRIGGGDGFLCRVDPEDPYTVYCEMQGGRVWRVNIKTGTRYTLRPPGENLKFNWKTPFTLSPHNSRIFYYAGNYAFRSLNRGENLKKISPKLGRTDRGTATAIAESHQQPGVLWIGTDDGALWLTRNGGGNWEDLSKKFDFPKPLHVSSIEASRFADGRVYVAFDGHRSDSDAPQIYATEDFGKTWKSIKANLPIGSTRCLREDAFNENVLYCGTEFGVYATLDRGAYWTRINNNLPTVAVHEIAVHPTAGEIVAGTHGRSAWVLDVTPLRQSNSTVLNAEAHLFAPANGTLWAGALGNNRSGQKNFAGKNPEFGSRIFYHLGEDAEKVTLEIRNARGQAIRRLPVKKTQGLHNARWDLRASARRPAPRPGNAGGPTGRSAPQLTRSGNAVKAGTYIVALTVSDKEYIQQIEVIADPEFPAGLMQEELDAETAKQRQEVIE